MLVLLLSPAAACSRLAVTSAGSVPVAALCPLVQSPAPGPLRPGHGPEGRTRGALAGAGAAAAPPARSPFNTYSLTFDLYLGVRS